MSLKRCIPCLLLLLPVAPLAADWPSFRHDPLHSGVAATKLPAKLEILWKFEAKGGFDGAAAVVGDTVYVGSQDEHLYAINLRDGKKKWHYKAGPFKAPVSVRDGAVYVGDQDGVFHCVDVAKGTKRWTFTTDGEISGGAAFSGEHVVFGSGDQNLYCLTREGKKVWEFKVPGGPVLATPVLVENKTFVAGCDSVLHIIDTAKGEGLKEIELGGQVGASGAVRGDVLYVGTMTNVFHAVDFKQGKILWTFKNPKRAQPYSSSAALADGKVIVGSRDRLVHCLDAKTGNPVWSFPTKGPVDSSPVVVDNRVIVGSLDGKLYVLNLKDGAEVQRFDLGRGVAASPAVANGRVVIGNDDGLLYCLGRKN
jgi:outer membrane protein assembly factor BamB